MGTVGRGWNSVPLFAICRDVRVYDGSVHACASSCSTSTRASVVISNLLQNLCEYEYVLSFFISPVVCAQRPSSHSLALPCSS